MEMNPMRLSRLPRIAFATLAAAALLAVAACAPAGPTGYRALSGKFGYEDARMADGAWRIVFYASAETARDRLENFVLYRAAELARSEGRPRFAVMEHGFQTLEETPAERERPPPGFEVSGAGFGRADPTLTREYEAPPGREPEIRLKADMLVCPYDGAPPDRAERLYETAEVLRVLGPSIRK
jgi:hypothetical protein